MSVIMVKKSINKQANRDQAKPTCGDDSLPSSLIMYYEKFAAALQKHASGDDKLWIGLMHYNVISQYA